MSKRTFASRTFKARTFRSRTWAGYEAPVVDDTYTLALDDVSTDTSILLTAVELSDEVRLDSVGAGRSLEITGANVK